MWTSSLVLFGICLCLCWIGGQQEELWGSSIADLDLLKKFEDFIVKFDKLHLYTGVNASVIATRFQRFKYLYSYVEAHNRRPGVGYKLQLNVFGDETEEERSSRFMTVSPGDNTVMEEDYLYGNSHHQLLCSRDQLGDTRSSLNWASKDNPFHAPVITTIRYQGTCGSCWAVVTAASTEAAIKLALLSQNSHQISIKNSSKTASPFNVPPLSVQDLLNCDRKYNSGCHGGDPFQAMTYVKVNGLVSEAYSRYYGRQGHCADHKNVDRYFLSVARRVKSQDPNALMSALLEGPVAVGICGTDSSFSLYSSGIYADETCCRILNHAVLLVGFGTDRETGTDYWVVQNSWGEMWGERGYMRILRSSEAGPGICGLQLNAVQALGGYMMDSKGRVHTAADDPASRSAVYWARLYIRLQNYVVIHWRSMALVLSLCLILASFGMLAYGFYLDLDLLDIGRRAGDRRGGRRGGRGPEGAGILMQRGSPGRGSGRGSSTAPEGYASFTEAE